MPKMKAPALNVPQSDREADLLLMLYGEQSRVVAELQTRMDAALARAKADFEGRAKPSQEVLKGLFEQLQAWGAANRSRLTADGKVKTVELPAGKIGWRSRPPSIRLTAKIDEVIKTLRTLKLARFIRVKYEVNKEALLEEPKRAATIAGIKVVTDAEDFYVEPFGADLSEPKP